MQHSSKDGMWMKVDLHVSLLDYRQHMQKDAVGLVHCAILLRGVASTVSGLQVEILC